MKTSHILLVPFVLMLTACDKDDIAPPPSSTACNTGILRCTNSSLHTVQRIVISGVNHGTLDPGETRIIELAPGNWTLRFLGIAGGPGCTESSFNIAACQTVSRGCSY